MGRITLPKNSLRELAALQKIIPFAPSARSCRMGWKSLQATRYGKIPASGELSFPTVSLHTLVLIIRPAERLQVRYEGVKRDKPLPAGSITVVPGGTSPLVRWRGSMDTLVIHLELSLVTRVATESFEFDSSGTVVPPLAGLNVPELRSVMLAVDAELSAGNGAGVLPMVESLVTILSVHLLRHTTSAQQRPASVNGMLPRRKLRTVIEFIMENLRFTPTLEQMADLAQLSPSHFLRQFKAATGLTPHQYVITRRVEQAQHLLRADDELDLAQIALRVGFSDQSHFSFHFKRIVGATPRQYRISARIS